MVYNLLFAVAAFQQAPTAALPIAEFMSACVQSGGDVGWIPATGLTGNSTLRGVYIGPTTVTRVTVSFYNEQNSGLAEVRWFNGSTEVVQAMGPIESLTVNSQRVRYGVKSTTVPTAVCTRTR